MRHIAKSHQVNEISEVCKEENDGSCLDDENGHNLLASASTPDIETPNAANGHSSMQWVRGKWGLIEKRMRLTGDVSRANLRPFPLPVPFRLAVQLVVGSFCCMAAALHATQPIWILFRLLLAHVSIGGFVRLFRRRQPISLMPQAPPPVLRIANYVKLVIVAATATLAATAATLAATAAMLATAVTVFWRAALEYGVGRERRRWYANVGGIILDILELGALLVQMILMTQWVFGEFSVMPVMTTMGMLFALFHNVHCYVGAQDGNDLFWWEGAF